ncbi:MAG: hypothetical protein HC831_00215 [Chloroflexia bacterium]|nr:hypothetical protein [Bacteroidales bacterium]NJO87541.1 hypothetical protein [Chloroflexia bacterium]
MLSIFCGCQKDSEVEAPEIGNITFSQVDASTGAETPVTEITSKQSVTIFVESAGNLCTVWPAGDRLTIKSKLNNANDSVDVYNNVVLTRSDDHKDYGLVGAKGRPMSFSTGGFSLKYTYANPGTYTITIIATKHGFNSTEYKQTLVKKEVVVK